VSVAVAGTEFIRLQSAVAGRYSLEREVGRGGMGIVFLARDVALDRPVAIKLLPPDMAAQPALRERFLREARIAAKLSHPNIVPIHAVEEIGDLVFFVMSFIEGETLGERLRTRGPLTGGEVARLLQEVAWALAYAHGRGVVHRDVKPDNIILERGSGRSIVTDFGIARVAGTAAGGELLGTPQYMSPEQARGDAVDGHSDLYSLGVVGFVALSGRLPFESGDTAQIIALQISSPAPPLGSVAPGAPRKLCQVIDRCLSKGPTERYASGEELAEVIEQATQLRRELPAPVRIWLTRGLESPAVMLAWMILVWFPSFMIALGFLFDDPFSGGSLIASSISLGLFALPIALQGGNRLLATRRLLRAGYGLEDMQLALRMEAERRREEMAFEGKKMRTPLGQVIDALTVISVGMLMIAAAAGLGWETVLAGLASAVGLVGGWRYKKKHFVVGDPAGERRLRRWSGKWGELFVRIAGWRLRHRAVPAELTHRPTELAIGLAADALFESLPKHMRKELRDLPAVTRRLEADAQKMRRTVDELNEVIATITDESAAAGSAALAAPGALEVGSQVAGQRQRLRQDLEATRDEAARRLATAVAALENIRLDLLRLKAGAGSVDELTADLSAARQLGRDIEAAVAARREVEELLSTRRISGPMRPSGAVRA
jgi:serine/threonine-protein kinase